MGGLIIAGICMATGAIFLMAKFNLRRFLGYAGPVDLGFTVGMLFVFAGTFSGIVAGAVAGVFLSIVLMLLRKCLGYERLTVKTTERKWINQRRLQWTRYDAEWVK